MILDDQQFTALGAVSEINTVLPGGFDFYGLKTPSGM